MHKHIRHTSQAWAEAFPEHQSLIVIHNRTRAVDRLMSLLAPPNQRATPEWLCWFPGGERRLITACQKTSSTTLLLPPYEYGLARIAAAVGPSSPYAWIYVETTPIETPGLIVTRTGDAQYHTGGQLQKRLKPRLLTPRRPREERRRSITPLNFLIVPTWSQLTSRPYQGPLSTLMRQLLNGQVELTALCETTTLIAAVDTVTSPKEQ